MRNSVPAIFFPYPHQCDSPSCMINLLQCKELVICKCYRKVYTITVRTFGFLNFQCSLDKMHRAIIRNSGARFLLKSGAKSQVGWNSITCCTQIQLRHGSSSKVVSSLLPTHDEFSIRHIGPRESDQKIMLEYLGYKVRHYHYLQQDYIRPFCRQIRGLTQN